MLTVVCDGSIELTNGSQGAAAASGLSFGTAGSINSDGGTGSNGANIALESAAHISVQNSTGTNGISARSVGGDGAINGTNGTGGNGGSVSVTASGAIDILSSSAAAILANSAGGTGAINGDGMGGAGGNVTVQSSAVITSAGFLVNGISAVSTGGVGAINGHGVGGQAGSVTVSSNGAISTTGDSSNGIFALSEGGAGAIGGSGPAGHSSAVSVFVNGDVTASGTDSRGVRAASSAGPQSSVNVDIGHADVRGGAGDGWGVDINAGSTAVLSNAGHISAASGQAVIISGQSIEVSNYGAMAGIVRFQGATDGIFSNFAAGELFAGNSVDLNGGTLTNYGSVAPGGNGAIETTVLNGNFNQPSGQLLVDADWHTHSADVLTVTGSAELAGQVVVNPLIFSGAVADLSSSFTILTANGGVTDMGITAVDTATVDYELLFPDANTMSLQATINFLGLQSGGLTGNQAAAGAALNSMIQSGGTAGFFGPLLSLGTQRELGAALDQLTPAGDAAQFASAMQTGTTFAGQLLSCKTLGDGDANAFIREGQCLWVRANVRQLDNDGRNGETGFDETATFYSAGAQFDVGGPWRVGAGIGFEDGDLRTGSNAQSETERLHLGAVVKYNPGPLLLAASLTGGQGWSDNTRRISFGGFNDVATSESDQTFLSGRLTGAYLFSNGNTYAKPQLDLAWTHLERDGYTENATGGTALTVAGSDETVFSVSPSLELGAEVALAFGGVARPYVKGGLTWFDSDSFITSAAFAGAPGAGGFAITTTIDDLVADLGLGVDFLAESGTVLRVQYDGQFGDQTEQHGGSAKLSVPF